MRVEEESDESEINCTPPEVSNTAREAIENLLPSKSRLHYEKAYRQFLDWRITKGVTNVSENVLLAYLSEKSKNVKASTLWATYSMLKSTLNIKENVDIAKFTKLVPFIKQQAVGYRAKKSKVFTREEISKFITEAPDEIYLFLKTVLIIGISGACRRDELTKLTVNDIKDKGPVLIINVLGTKTDVDRTFTITNSDYIEIYRKYFKLE